MFLLFKSFILGFSVSAPIGPIGLLVIQRTLSKGKMAGFITGFGAVAANIIYASIAALGFSLVTAFLLDKQFYMKLIGAAFLFYLGVKTILKDPAKQSANLEGESYPGMFLSTFLLMVTNPITIINFVAMFAGLGFDQNGDSKLMAFSLILGVFLGATCWWFLLSLAVSLFENKIKPHLSLVNNIAGVLIITLGFLAFIK